MNTIILSPKFSIDSEKIRKASFELGYQTHRAVRMNVPESILNDSETLSVFGDRYFCESIARRYDLALLDPPYDWLPNLPSKYLHREIDICDAGTHLKTCFGRAFYKTATADKLFEAGIYESGADLPLRYISEDLPVLISEIVDFVAEVRLHILDKKVVSAAYYKLVIEKEPEEVEKEAVDWVQDLLDSEHVDYLPSSVVIDVGIINEKGWAVVEANQVYSSGIYKERVDELLVASITRSSGRTTQTSFSDQKFKRL